MAIIKIDADSLSWGGSEFTPIKNGKNKGNFDVPNAAVQDLIPHGAVLISTSPESEGDAPEA